MRPVKNGYWIYRYILLCLLCVTNRVRCRLPFLTGLHLSIYLSDIPLLQVLPPSPCPTEDDDDDDDNNDDNQVVFVSLLHIGTSLSNLVCGFHFYVLLIDAVTLTINFDKP